MCFNAFITAVCSFGSGQKLVLTVFTSSGCKCTKYTPERIIQIYSGITRGKVLNGELYVQRLQFIYMYLNTDCFMKISLQIYSEDWREIFMKQFVSEYR